MNKSINSYSLHDCYMLFPFKISDNKIMITCDLAKHLQSEEKQEQYKKSENDRHHIIEIEFTNCANLKSIEESFKSKQDLFRRNAKVLKEEVTFNNFDTDLDFVSVSISTEKNNFYAYFSNNDLKRGHISFDFDSVSVVNESFINEITFQELIN